MSPHAPLENTVAAALVHMSAARTCLLYFSSLFCGALIKLVCGLLGTTVLATFAIMHVVKKALSISTIALHFMTTVIYLVVCTCAAFQPRHAHAAPCILLSHEVQSLRSVTRRGASLALATRDWALLKLQLIGLHRRAADCCIKPYATDTAPLRYIGLLMLSKCSQKPASVSQQGSRERAVRCQSLQQQDQLGPTSDC